MATLADLRRRSSLGVRGHVDHFAVSSLDLRTGRRERIASVPLGVDEGLGGIAVGSDQMVRIVIGKPGRAFVHDLRTGATSEFISENEGGFGYPVGGDGFVAWAESSGAAHANVGGYVKLSDGGLYSLGNKSSLYGVEAAGRYLAWQEGAAGDPRGKHIKDVVVRLH